MTYACKCFSQKEKVLSKGYVIQIKWCKLLKKCSEIIKRKIYPYFGTTGKIILIKHIL